MAHDLDFSSSSDKSPICTQVNTSPFDLGWIIKVKLSNTAELDTLMDSAAYKKEIEH